MKASHTPSGERLWFLDNVRVLIIFLVVVFHVAAGYFGLPEFYTELDSGGFFLTLRNILAEIPLMPMLFFLAGYFALISLRGRCHGQFLKHKLQHLGASWLIGVLLLGPTMPYLGYYSQSFSELPSASYWDFWLNYVKSGFDRWLSPVSFTTNTQFHHQHYWFLSVLLQFFVLFTLLHAAWKQWGQSASPTLKAGRRTASFTRALLVAGLLMAAAKVLGHLFQLPRGVFAFFFFISPALITYASMFALGIYAYTRNWFVEGDGPGLRTFGVLSGLLVMVELIETVVEKFWNQAPSFLFVCTDSLFQSLFILWFMTIFTGPTSRYLNRPSTLNTKLAANSYNIYLIHYPLILVFRFLLLRWDGSAFLKFPIVLLLAFLTSYALSEYLIRPLARLPIASLIGLKKSSKTVGQESSEAVT